MKEYIAQSVDKCAAVAAQGKLEVKRLLTEECDRLRELTKSDLIEVAIQYGTSKRGSKQAVLDRIIQFHEERAED